MLSVRFGLFVILLGSCHVQTERYKTIYQKIQREPEYSGFNDLVRNNRVVRLNLHYEPLTVFVPENQAFDNYDGDIYADLVLYHMSFEVKTLKLLKTTNAISSINLYNPPLWITKVNEDIYVNNAKILQDKSDYVAKSRDGAMGHQQVLHMIDQVLDPKIRSPEFSPSAYDFLTTAHKWDLGASKRVHKFLQRVQDNKLLDLYKGREPHTFLVPVDSGIDPHKYNMIDRNVILRHIVPNHVLFSRPADKNVVTMSGDDNTFALSFEKKAGRLHVKAISKEGSDSDFEEFSSEIVVPDIPVKNGVVHLISHPLGIFDSILKPFPYLPVLEKVTNDPDLDIFYKMGSVTKFNQNLDQDNVSLTYFIPKDSGWLKTKDLGLEPTENNHDILARHLVISESPYSMKQLASMTRVNNYTDIELRSEGGPLRIAVFKIDGSYYIRWEKKYIEVVRPDYQCTNGVVHILNGPMVHFTNRSDASYNDTEGIGQSLLNYWRIVKQLDF